MKNYYFVIVLFFVKIGVCYASSCGCKTFRSCYKEMLDTLKDHDEVNCIEDAAIGASTMVVFLTALQKFCSEVISVHNDNLSYEGRPLYEVVLSKVHDSEKDDDKKPTIVLEAGQHAGTEPVALALYIIEQLVACHEHNEIIEKIRWVILPCTNPDGQEYSRFNRMEWKKNLRPSDDKLSFGVDISRNFDSQWSSCDRNDNTFSPHYPGLAPASENETIFIKNVLNKYKNDIKVYVSIRRDGHSLLYPYGYTKNNPSNSALITKVAGEVTAKVNLRAGSVQVFINESIFDYNGKAHCGHSVDYAYDLGISLAYEMRVFLGSANRIMSRFQTLPRGYEGSLRAGYFSGIREIYNVITNDKKYGIRVY